MALHSVLCVYHLLPSLCIADIVVLKGGSSFPNTVTNTTDILQHDLLCNGNETDLLQCPQYNDGTRDCPIDHTEDAGIKCNCECFAIINFRK